MKTLYLVLKAIKAFSFTYLRTATRENALHEDRGLANKIFYTAFY